MMTTTTGTNIHGMLFTKKSTGVSYLLLEYKGDYLVCLLGGDLKRNGTVHIGRMFDHIKKDRILELLKCGDWIEEGNIFDIVREATNE